MQGVQPTTAMPTTRPPLSPQQLREEASSSCATGHETSVSYINSAGEMEQHMTPDHPSLEQRDTACGMYTATTTSNGAVEMRERVHTPAAMGQPEVNEAFEIQYELKEDERSGSSKATEEKKSDTNTNTTSLTPTATREKTSGSAHKGVKAFFQRMRGSSDNLLQKDEEKNAGSAHVTPSHKQHHNQHHQHNRIMSDDLEDHMLGSAYNAHDICPSCGYPRMSSVWCPITQRHHGTDELAQSASASGNAGEHHKSHLHWRTNSKNFMSLVKGKFTAGAGSERRHRPYPIHSTAEGDNDEADEAAVEGNDIEDGSPASLSPRCVNKHNHHHHHHKNDNSSTPTAQSAGAAEALIFDTHAAAMTTQAFSMPVVALMPSLDDAAVSESNTINNNNVNETPKAEEAVMTACEVDVGDEARRRLLGHEPVATVVYCDEDIPSNNNTTNDGVVAVHEELDKSNHEGEEGNTTAAEVKETPMMADDTEPQYYCYVDEYGNTTYYLATTNAVEADEAQEVFQAEENHANEISFTEEVPGAEEEEEVIVQEVVETVAEGASQQPNELHPSPSAIAVNADEKSVSAASVSPSSSSAVAAETVTRKKSNLAAKIGHFFHSGMNASSSGHSAKKKKDKKAKSEESTTPKTSPALKPEVLSPALSVHVDPQSAGQTNNTLLLTTENVTPQPETSATLNTLVPSHATPNATQGETNNAISPSSPETADITPGTVSLGGMSVSKGTKQSIKLLEKEEKKAREAIRKSAKEDGEELMRQCRALAVALSNSAPRLRTRKVKKGEPL